MKIPVILGTTATGKTAIGITLAKEINGEVISVDSRKVYKGLPIGTATPKGTWENNIYRVNGIPHHLMGHLSPDNPYTAGDFAKDAERLMGEIISRNRTPVLVGGTGFYFRALFQGLPKLPARDNNIRSKLASQIEKEGLDSLFNELEKADPLAAKKISKGDSHKIIRALEILELTGLPYSSWKNLNLNPSKFSYEVMALRMDKDETLKRIEKRSRQMLKDGMIEEAEAVIKAGHSKTCPALLSFGYREAVEVIEGTLSKEDFLTRLIKQTNAYAKRQRTYFRTQIKPRWIEYTGSADIREISLKMNGFL